MLKFFLIVLLFGYLFFKLIGLVFKFLIGGASAGSNNQRNEQYKQNSRKPSDGNVNIDYVPKKDKNGKKDFDAGEYVDYEEIK